MEEYTNEETLVLEIGSEHVSDTKPYTVKSDTGCSASLQGVRKLVIGEGIEEIDSDAFKGCQDLCKVVLPDDLKKIGPRAFSGCTGLNSIVIPGRIEEISYEAFCECKSLTSIVISNGVKTIGWKAFYGCAGLTDIVIPNSVTTIRAEAFKNCTGLASITLPNSITQILKSTFCGCTGLIDIVIPASVKSIGNEAFLRCKRLSTIIIPDSVKEIGYQAFAECEQLTRAFLPAYFAEPRIERRNVRPAFRARRPAQSRLNNSTFEGCKTLKKTFVPADELDSAKGLAAKLDKMIIDETATTNDIAALLSQAMSKGDTLMTLLAELCKRGVLLLEAERLRQWPEAHADALCDFILRMPYILA